MRACSGRARSLARSHVPQFSLRQENRPPFDNQHARLVGRAWSTWSARKVRRDVTYSTVTAQPRSDLGRPLRGGTRRDSGADISRRGVQRRSRNVLLRLDALDGGTRRTVMAADWERGRWRLLAPSVRPGNGLLASTLLFQTAIPNQRMRARRDLSIHRRSAVGIVSEA